MSGRGIYGQTFEDRSESDEISAGAIIQAKACDTRPTAHKSIGPSPTESAQLRWEVGGEIPMCDDKVILVIS